MKLSYLNQCIGGMGGIGNDKMVEVSYIYIIAAVILVDLVLHLIWHGCSKLLKFLFKRKERSKINTLGNVGDISERIKPPFLNQPASPVIPQRRYPPWPTNPQPKVIPQPKPVPQPNLKPVQPKIKLETY